MRAGRPPHVVRLLLRAKPALKFFAVVVTVFALSACDCANNLVLDGGTGGRGGSGGNTGTGGGGGGSAGDGGLCPVPCGSMCCSAANTCSMGQCVPACAQAMRCGTGLNETCCS